MNPVIKKLTICFLLFGFIECKQQGTKIQRENFVLGNTEKELVISSWPNYLESGKNNSEFDWVSIFEEETGCKIQNKNFEKEEEIENILKNENIDLMILSSHQLQRFASLEYLKKLDEQNIPNFSKIDSRIKQNALVKQDEQLIGIPLIWAPNYMLYNKFFFSEKPDSWAITFEKSEGPDNWQKITAYDDPLYIADAILYLKYKNPELEITDIYKVNQKTFHEAIQILKRQKVFISGYWKDAYENAMGFNSGEIMASIAWPYQLETLRSLGNTQFKITVPKEGATGWMDHIAMSQNSKNPNCAYKYINYLLDKKVQADISAWIGSNPVIPEACLENDLLKKDACSTHGFPLYDRIYFWKHWECQTGEDCVSMETWKQEFSQLKSLK